MTTSDAAGVATTPALRHVHPGDIITPAFFNGLVVALAALQAQLDDLTPGAGPRIASVQPAGPGPVTAGSVFTILGSGFLVPAKVGVVTLAGSPAAAADRWPLEQVAVLDDGRISARVPAALTPANRQMVLTVTSSAGSDDAVVWIAAAPAVASGPIVVKITRTNAAPAGERCKVKIELDGAALAADESFDIVATFESKDVPPVEWKPVTLALDAPSVSGPVTVPGGGAVALTGQFDVPVAARSMKLTVRANSPTLGSAASGWKAVDLQFVAPAQPPDEPAVKLDPGDDEVEADGRRRFDVVLTPSGFEDPVDFDISIEYPDLADTAVDEWLDGTVVDPDPVSVIPPATTAQFAIRVDVPETVLSAEAKTAEADLETANVVQTPGVRMRVTATSADGLASDTLEIQVPLPLPEVHTVDMSIGTLEQTAIRDPDDKVSLQRGTSGRAEIEATFQVAGTYGVHGVVEGQRAAQWSVIDPALKTVVAGGTAKFWLELSLAESQFSFASLGGWLRVIARRVEGGQTQVCGRAGFPLAARKRPPLVQQPPEGGS